MIQEADMGEDETYDAEVSSDDENDDEMYDQVEPLFSDVHPTLMDTEGEERNEVQAKLDAAGDDSITKKYPKLVFGGLVLLALCFAALAGGLFLGLSQTKRSSGDGSLHAGNGKDRDENDRRPDSENTGEHITDSDNPSVLPTMSANPVGLIWAGKFVSMDSEPLKISLPTFGPATSVTYSDCDTLKDDLHNALNIIANDVILERNYHHRYYPLDIAEGIPEGDGSKSSREDSFETNNQVKGVDEADVIKSTENYVFAAYGEQLVVWDAVDGDKLSVTNMKELSQKHKNVRAILPVSTALKIRSLLVHDDRLVAFVEGYKKENKDSSGNFLPPKVLEATRKTKIHIFDISSIPNDGGKLQLVASRDLRGDYIDARMVGSTVHVVSMSKINTFLHFSRYVQRGAERFDGMNTTEYLDNVVTYTRNLIVPSFAERLMNETGLVQEACSDVLRMSVLRTASQNATVPSVDSIVGGLVDVVSFDINGSHSKENIESVKLSAFVPKSSDLGTVVYSSSDTLVLAHRGYDYSSESLGSWDPSTFSMSFALDSSSPNGVKLQGIAQTPGYVMNQYALDIWDGHLRIASSVHSKWGCRFDNESNSTNKMCIWDMLKDSDNFLSIYKLDSPSVEMDRVGFLGDLGEVGETIKAVRFMEDKGWVVTFLQKDPLYSIDLSDHSSPQVKGELKITGYSTYLHPYDDEGKFIIGIGQDADENGRATGLQISLFDTSDLSNTNLVHKYVEGANSQGSISKSIAEYDPKAFRFLPKSKKLIIPSSARVSKSSEYFDGFSVYDISTERIEPSFRISHVSYEDIENFCWSSVYLQPRSLVHNGIVTTIKGHTVFAHDLDTEKKKWELNLDLDSSDCVDGGYWTGADFEILY